MRTFQRWLNFWDSLSAPGDAVRIFAELDRLYSEPGRYYHNWHHIGSCLDELAGCIELSRSPTALEMALWFHDAVYDTRLSDNEEQSALLAVRAGREMGISEKLLAEVAMLILMTRHSPFPDRGNNMGRDAALISDIDLVILGKSRQEFESYEENIRKEYCWIPEAQFLSSRSAFLKELSERSCIYRTEQFRKRYEAQARRNLSWSIGKEDA